MSSKKDSHWLWELAKTCSIALIVAGTVRAFAFEPFNIPSGSMIPTLLVGDYLFVSKYSYGYSRHSLPWSWPIIPGRIMISEPERGDVAVFKLPSDNTTDYIKRIVGLPGDRIQMRQGRLWINEKQVKRRRIEDFVYTDGFRRINRLAQFVETLPNGRVHRIVEQTDQGQLDNTGVYTVPKGHYFAMGDNRDNSLDSRVMSGVGFVPFENLVGRAEVLFFSTDGGAGWWEFWRWPGATRFHRFFQSIE